MDYSWIVPFTFVFSMDHFKLAKDIKVDPYGFGMDEHDFNFRGLDPDFEQVHEDVCQPLVGNDKVGGMGKDHEVCTNENGLHTFGDGGLDVFTEHEVLQMEFHSEEHAHCFYNAYARTVGFSIRKDKVRWKGNFVLSRRWVCSRQGYRAKVHLDRIDRTKSPRSITRVGCPAEFCITFDRKSQKYKVNRFFTKHNHDMATQHCVHFLRSHRSIPTPIKAQVEAMRAVGVKTNQIMDYMVRQYGSYENVGFIKKDLHNHVQVERQTKTMDGDAEAALAYFCAKVDTDPLFFYKYDVDADNRLDKLFWSDSKSRMDYAAFGDVLAFDTTYKTNQYEKPFVILAGVNNHFQSIIFGCTLLVDETIASYTWVLRTLLEAMDNKSPVSVLTDGDHSMREAIKLVFPNARHRLCNWHLHRNSMTNVHSLGFGEAFKQVMTLDGNVNEFEEAWTKMVKQYGLENNKWVKDTYDNRAMWAESYLRGDFFAGMKSTQRCEGMHAFFKTFLPLKLKLFEFVHHYDRAISRLRNNEAQAEAITENSEPLLTTPLRRLEKHGSDILTRNMFFMFRDEIKKALTMVVNNKIENTDHRAYSLSKWTVQSSNWEVLYYPATYTMRCSCKKFESFGLPCCHMIYVMKCEHITEIPLTCVKLRWMKTAAKRGGNGSQSQLYTTHTQPSRFGILCSSFNEMCYYATQTKDGFEEALQVSRDLTSRMKKLCATKTHEAEEGKGSVPLFGVIDPKKVKTKGNPGGNCAPGKPPKPRRCRGCGYVYLFFLL